MFSPVPGCRLPVSGPKELTCGPRFLQELAGFMLETCSTAAESLTSYSENKERNTGMGLAADWEKQMAFTPTSIYQYHDHHAKGG